MTSVVNEHLTELLAAEPHRVSRAMRELGSHFYRALADALDRADPTNRRLILQTWTEAIWSLYDRGRALPDE